MTQAGDKQCDGRPALLLLVVVYLSNVRKVAKTTTHVDSIKLIPQKKNWRLTTWSPSTRWISDTREVSVRRAASPFFVRTARAYAGRDRISRLVCVCTGSALQRVVACQAGRQLWLAVDRSACALLASSRADRSQAAVLLPQINPFNQPHSSCCHRLRLDAALRTSDLEKTSGTMTVLAFWRCPRPYFTWGLRTSETRWARAPLMRFPEHSTTRARLNLG